MAEGTAVEDMAEQDTVEQHTADPGTAVEDMAEHDMAGGTEAIGDILVVTMVGATCSSASATGLGITRRPITIILQPPLRRRYT